MADPGLLSLLSWLSFVVLLPLAILPWLSRTFREYAAPVAMTASILAFGAITWYLALLHLPLELGLLPFILAAAGAAITRRYRRDTFREYAPYLVVFLVFFCVLLEVRLIDPTISFAEKFMDHAMLASIMRSPQVPPLDPWFAGGFLNVYYYLGYWICGAIALVTRVPSVIAFNCALPTFFGLSAAGLLAIGRLVAGRFGAVLPGVLLLPNPAFFVIAITGTPAGQLLWNSTRVIGNTIHEYPAFSFVWGDVHPHVMGIPVQVLLVFLLLFALLSWPRLDLPGRLLLVGTSALALGSMPPVNSWDVLVYAPLVLVVGAVLWWQGRRAPVSPAPCHQGPPWLYLIGVPLAGVALYAPYYLEMVPSGIRGIGIVTVPSVPSAYLLVHGFALAVLYVALGKDIIRRPWLTLVAVPVALAGYPAAALAIIPLVYLVARRHFDPEDLLLVAGLAIIIFCEFLYLQDSMGETYFRMNTVFKFYTVSNLLLGAGCAVLLARGLDRLAGPRPLTPLARRLLPAAAIVALLVAPAVISPLTPHGPGTLDGMAYLETEHPADAAAIRYLRALPPDPSFVLVEAEGGDYTYYSRISTFTGIPAILGMPFHEYQWRGGGGSWFGERQGDIRAIYEDPSRTVSLMRKYDATLLVIGKAERDQYTVRAGDGTPGLRLLCSAGDTSIYTTNGQPAA